ncbi:hypothetical protein GO730_30755 [Spirosoma sp. HMF3257]|uniref:Uncharacterized protein n=1 Tax=Spirosoma telluris TaxID=2183553 RepID=A0A327NX31_9BACT|nr:hypothetical protein [Spirosoma telluris]RAI77448.1 hypothetical protein HMF3257_30660 [Spirosoma telluris]
MNLASLTINWHQISYRVSGFDRLNLVSDIANAIPQDDACQIARLDFEADGVQARGWLIIRVRQQQGFTTIQDRLRAVRVS